MFLAIKEMLRQKSRYLLLIFLLTLIAYLVFFLSGLAYGLSNSFRSEIDRWGADKIVLSDTANQSLIASMIDRSKVQEIDAEEKAEVNILQATLYVNDENDEDKGFKAALLGYTPDSFVAPECIEGRETEAENEVLLSLSLKEEMGIKIGDSLILPRLSLNYKVTGFVKDSSYAVSPIVYASLSSFSNTDLMIAGLKEKNPDAYAMAKAMMPEMIQAVAIRGELAKLPVGLEAIDLKSFIWKLPGYGPQLLTFTFMIVFLIMISTLVIAVFMFILTLQKERMFGVMKAQGVPQTLISRSVIVQSFLLTLGGIIMALILTIVTAACLPNAVPFEIYPMLYIVIALAMLISSLLGSSASVRRIKKIDPLEVI